MNSKDVKKAINKARLLNIEITETNIKTINRLNTKQPKSRWYNINSLFGNDWAIFYGLFGPGDTGKSYAVMKWMLNRKYKDPDNVKLYWTRLSEVQCRKMLQDNAKGLVDPDLYRKFGKELRTKGEVVYYGHEDIITTKTGKEQVKFIRENELMRVLPLSTFFNNKGQAIFDNEYKGEYYIVLDEAVRDSNGERNNFDIVEAFTNQLENLTRDTKCKVKVIFIGNNCGDSDILANFNFIPRVPGRYKLKSRKCIIDFIGKNEQYIKDRSEAVASLFNKDSSRFADQFLVDETLIAHKSKVRESKPSYILCFGKQKKDWFTVYNNIIRKYNNECKHIYAMKPYLDQQFNPDIFNTVVDIYNNRGFLYDNCSTYILFTSALSKVKK